MDDGAAHPTPDGSSPRSAAEPPDPVDAAVRRIRAHGERVTVARTAVLRVLADTQGYLTADQAFVAVNRAAPGVHRTTIYRALDALERLGLVVQTRMGPDAAAYRLAASVRGDGPPRLHVICRACGHVGEAPADLLDAVARRLAEESGFRLDPTAVALAGHCEACAENPARRR
ncbi:transcriptional repressor [Yinghuangia sp. ASG 101]|uniref:Fur family transcriptional regulator n=1 Tax=Yinghuangia sp. ASG 101 TaxID=2896848 RepID=UPI001E52B2A7|nr:transcriptional repressor [Yinghuangia sp. ASG 101]UGQ10390.1 transcriptional repressor [Yinghuangia sp. ASG 101]